MATPQEWYYGLPIVTRVWITGAVLSGIGARFGLLQPYTIAFIPSLTFEHFQVWRLVTNFFFLGVPSFNWLIRLLMLSQYAPALEREPFPSGGGPRAGNTADFIYMMIVGMVVTLFAGWCLGLSMLASALLAAVVYVWSKRHPEQQTSFYGFGFKAAYLPWVLLGFAFIVGGDVHSELIGIVAGHSYYFVQEVLPHLETPLRGYKLLRTPDFLYRMLSLPPTHEAAAFAHLRAAAAGVGRAAAPGGHNWGGQGVPLGRRN